MTPTATELAGAALGATKDALAEGLIKLDEFTESDAYVALDIARCTLESIPGGDNPAEVADGAVRRWRHEGSPWAEARV